MSQEIRQGLDRAALSEDALQAAQRLHSRYNPQAEAERYIAALNPGDNIEYFILIEPGLGYLVPALNSKYPNRTIIALHADSRFRGMPAGTAGTVPSWFPDSGISVQDFLEQEIPDIEAAAIRIIEWRPSLAVYGQSCLQLVSETVEFIKRAAAGSRTAAVFGKRWLRNFFRNAALVQTALQLRPRLPAAVFEKPLVITGSGPGLEKALPLIAAVREHIIILAASSSFLALAEGGLIPDIVISTDGGAWALLHLYSPFRFTAHRSALPLAVSFFAALPSQCTALPLLVLNEGARWQNIVLQALGIRSIIVPQRGTVTASALDLALLLGGGDIYLAGMDLAVQDIRSHARPYGFDHLFSGSASRLRPVYSQCFARSAAIRQGGSHDIYAAWFKKHLAALPRRIFSLGGSHAVFGKPADAIKLPPGQHNTTAPGYFSGETINGDAAERIRRGKNALFTALDDSRYSQSLCAELSPLLFPGEKDIPAQRLQAALDALIPRMNRLLNE